MKKNFLLRIVVASIIAMCVGYGISRVTEKIVCSNWDFEDSWIVSIIEAYPVETQDESFSPEWSTMEWDIRFLFLGGEYRGTEANIRVEHLEQSKLELKPGVSYILSCNEYEDGERQYFVSDVFRVPQLAGVFFGAVAFFCIVTGAAGIRALLGLGLSLFVLIKLFLPGLLKGYSPQIMSIAAVSAIALVTVVTVLRKKRCWPAAFSGAVAGCASALLFGWFAVALLRLNGISTEETSLLASSVSFIDIRGILIASIIVGASGAVLDV
ncbi:MAG: YibE/F family protein, partial [Synergistota bacterium]|nr:YibE/F family protein [Synergistota bacterium]